MSVASIINGNLTLGKLSFTDGTSQTTANSGGGSSILGLNNTFTGNNTFSGSTEFSGATGITVFKGDVRGFEDNSLINFNSIGCNAFYADGSNNTLEVYGNTTITTQLTTPVIYYGSNPNPQTAPYLGSSNKPYIISASTSTNEASPTPLTGFTVLILNNTFTLTDDVFLSLPVGYSQEKFVFLNENLSSTYNVYLTIGVAGDRITYFNTTVNSINQVSTLNNFLLIPKQQSTSQIGFAYVFEALQNSGLQWIVSTIPIASLNDIII